MNTELWAVGLVVAATLIGSLGPLFLKRASGRLTYKISKLLKNRSLYAGCFFYAIGTILFIPALKGGDLSVLYPLVALSYVWVSFLSIKFLNEKMNKMKWVGIGLILFGVSLIGLGS